MLPDLFLADVGKIDQNIKSLSNKIKALQRLQQKFRNDLFFGVQACAEINTIQKSIESLLYKKILRGIEAIKLKYGYKGEQDPHLKRLGNKLNNVLLEYLQVSKDSHASMPDEAITEHIHAPEYGIEQLQIAPRLRQKDFVYEQHQQIMTIERQITQLSVLYNQMLRLVLDQEAAVELIGQRGDEVVQAVDSGNEQLDKGIAKRRSCRSKKKWCWVISSKYTTLGPKQADDGEVLIVIAIGRGMTIVIYTVHPCMPENPTCRNDFMVWVSQISTT